ncbi:hypothetical protein DDF62_10370 [Caulobacter radicis]|nr:hypothetical protein DDF62_10370 [Caulobacter radicis]
MPAPAMMTSASCLRMAWVCARAGLAVQLDEASGVPIFSRHSRPCGGNLSVGRKSGWGGSPAIRWRLTRQLNQGFPPQGRE